MAEYQQQNRPQYFENAANSQQQPDYLYSTGENSRPNNPRRNEYIRDDFRKIYIGQLDKNTTEKDLRDHFGQFGEIQYIDIKVEASTGLCKGFAFVVYRRWNGLNNALACTNHVINNKRIEPKKAIPRRIKLFVGGLSLDLTDADIKQYFRNFAYIVRAEMPFDYIRNQRRRFCFLTFDNMQAVTEILRLPRHVIKGKQVDVKVAALNVHDYRIMNGTSRNMEGTEGNVMGQREFPPQSGYAHHAPGCCYGGYCYYIPHSGYSPNYSSGYGSSSYGHPSYGHPSYGSSSYGHPSYGHPSYGHPSYGHPSYGHPSYGHPSYGHPSYGHPSYGHPSYGHPSYGHPSYGCPSYGYPIYVGSAAANNEYRGNGPSEASASSGVNGN